MAEINAARWLVDYRSGKSHLARSWKQCTNKIFKETKAYYAVPWRQFTFPEWVLLSWKNKWPKCYVSRWKQRRTKQQFGKCCKHCFYNTLMASFWMERLLFIKKFTLYFRRLIFFLWSIVIVLLLQQVHSQKPPVYTAESCSNESVFWFFLQYKLQSNTNSSPEQTAIQQSHIINPLLTMFARSGRESIAFGFYRTDLAPSSLGLYDKPQAILFPYRPRTRLISPYYITEIRKCMTEEQSKPMIHIYAHTLFHLDSRS